jgi:hypothetical protein
MANFEFRKGLGMEIVPDPQRYRQQAHGPNQSILEHMSDFINGLEYQVRISLKSTW